MTTPRSHLDIFNSQSYEFWKPILDNFELIASVLGVIAFIGWVVGFRPRARRNSQTSYIDFESDHIFEEIQLTISWGRVFFLRKIKLPRIERNATVKVLCKSLGGIKDILHMDYYDEKSSGSSRTIYLVNKGFFKKNEIENIFLEITWPISQDCRDKIKIHQTSRRIEVLNWNRIEVRGLPIELPTTITLNKMLKYSAYFNQWKIPRGRKRKITAFLKSISPCKGEEPGKVTIPLS